MIEISIANVLETHLTDNYYFLSNSLNNVENAINLTHSQRISLSSYFSMRLNINHNLPASQQVAITWCGLNICHG